MKKLTIEIPSSKEEQLKASLKEKSHTLNSWITEQFDLLLEEQIFLNSGANAKGVEVLASMDWAFTDEATSIYTHDIHPYPAKFIPQIPNRLICALSEEGDVVLDPFAGSCTTATEASRLGRYSISIDANPLSALIGKAKTIKFSKDDNDALESLKVHLLSYKDLIKTDKENLSPILLEQLKKFIPDIPNIDKWFMPFVITELALIKFFIDKLDRETAKILASVALSRIIIKNSNQDSETRYTAIQKDILPSQTLSSFLDSLNFVLKKVKLSLGEFEFHPAKFLVGDSRYEMMNLDENSVDLIVTSPPYANATDYHLYHRFRMFWMGFDPRELGKIEIGSHLKHQRNDSGYEEYKLDMTQILKGMYRVLKPGKYAALVVGDSIFKNEIFETHKILVEDAKGIGFEHISTIVRPLHETKRSFVKPGRRLRQEQIVIVKKPETKMKIIGCNTKYKLFEYEKELLVKEIEALLNRKVDIMEKKGSSLKFSNFEVSSFEFSRLKHIIFAHEFTYNFENQIHTNQFFKENTLERTRKNSTYFTHGLHAYKGKFYPQLAASLINIATKHNNDSQILDPFCGSGTTVLEAVLGGHKAFGIDMNPLAYHLSKSKNEILLLDRNLVRGAIKTLSYELTKFDENKIYTLTQFPIEISDELYSWFPSKVVVKLDYILSKIRVFGDTRLVNYFEMILSSIVRSISQQDPQDLRIRRRKEEIEDAPAIELLLKSLIQEQEKLEHFWKCEDQGCINRGTFSLMYGDNKSEDSYLQLGIEPSSIDAIITSPPYCTALPYIDTDRLSILILKGFTSKQRATIEKSLTGSRDITNTELNEMNRRILEEHVELPEQIIVFLKMVCTKNLNDKKAGFRKKNTAALLLRYFEDMKAVLNRNYEVLKEGASAYYVVGDSKTQIEEEWCHIKTCEYLLLIGESLGFEVESYLDISVTNDNKINSKNFIESNSILKFKKPLRMT
ncbi:MULTISPECIES: DNA methyltransferase [Acinetobacter]|uniref:site-specific DNA-methyltransferase (cytosine-N(4)-specific) n=1 Tax=Acinetobacter baumannii EGD-HP18 TaxID=1358412 RepID=A0AAV3JUE4_ACIBA|nr:MULTISPECIES: DNA methyltransferase [Acinetobacter]EKU5928588.1 site-specific DNA-methyltransferase [Acinetobacter baumannii]EKW4875861.1 site-specific DNA-methyltransferase [Acinetobacter baumannii]EKW4877311.1 site-specific DNA-methyltransferase [Acinetobacter baumannii]ERH65437.1 hypothetical protein N173_10685 [Acinetobacter baumannii EGD-HP18]MBJ9388794.1 site-specific DNA-methyltransferase [Acinetobacter baumannii]